MPRYEVILLALVGCLCCGLEVGLRFCPCGVFFHCGSLSFCAWFCVVGSWYFWRSG